MNGLYFYFLASCLVRKPLVPTREKSISHSSTSSAEEAGTVASNLVDPYTLISKSSASHYRNNESISSNVSESPGDDEADPSEGMEPINCDEYRQVRAFK